ncbi:MAG: type II secretion system F family protein [Myxococcales bacterium]
MAQAAAAQAKAKAPVWVWEAKTKSGDVKKGEMEAADAEAVNARLRSLGYSPVKVKKKPVEINIKLPGMGGVSQKDLVVFTRTFATMIDAGLPLVQCLEILAGQTDNPAMRTVLSAVKAKVESGATFADSLKDHPKVFDELYVQLIAAGEVGGILDTILNRLAAYIEKNDKLRRRVKSAMTYPIIVLVVAIGVTAVLLLKVTPTFEKMFKDFGGAMPAPTQFVIDMSAWLQEYILHILGGIAAFVISFRAFVKHPKGRVIFDKVILFAPVIGPVIRKVAVARFTRTLGTMISSGVPILDALDVVAKTAGNRTVESAIYYVRAKISEGKTIAAPLLETGVFPPMVVQMIGVGEATGAMDQMLNKIADFYDDEVDTAIAGLTAMIEPLLMVFLGAVVGGFLIAMYLPIFSIAGSIK